MSDCLAEYRRETGDYPKDAQDLVAKLGPQLSEKGLQVTVSENDANVLEFTARG